MTDITTRLAEYPALPPAQRAEVDAFVAGHPEWAEQHAEAQAFAALLDAATEDTADQHVRQATGEHLGLAAGEDPVRKFERLTGRTLDPPVASEGNGHARDVPVAAPDRPVARVAGRTRRTPRWIALAAGLVAIVYSGLWTLSLASVSERAQLAALGELSGYEAPTLRGADADALATRLDAALDRVEDARQSTLGLFPRYDTDALTDAASDLNTISTEAEPKTSISQEARFALGRVYLYLGRDVDAAHVLGTLVRGGGYRAPAARRLLDYLRAQEGA